MEKKLIKLVNEDEVAVSTFDKPILSAKISLPCFGILLYERNNKIAILGHVSTDWKFTLMDMLRLVDFNKKNNFEYIIIFDGNLEKVQNSLLSFFQNYKTTNVTFNPFDNKYIDYNSKLFAFDSQTGNFIKCDENYLETIKTK